MNDKVNVPMTGGVNLFKDPSKIRDDQIAYGKNLAPVEPGVIGTRPAMRLARALLVNPPLGPFIPVRAMPSPIGPEFALAFYSSAAGKTYFTLIDENGTAASQELGTSDSPVPVSMVQWDGDTYAFTGYNTGVRAAFANNAAGYIHEALTFEGTGNTGFKPKGAAVIRDRFVYWGFEDGAGGRSILFADRGFPLRIGDSAVASSRFLPVAGIAQSGITHGAELGTSAAGSPNQSTVAVWTTDNMWMLLGEPGETGDGATAEAIRGTLQQNLLTMNAGCVSGATVVQTPYGTIWAGPDDVWFMPFGSLPVRIGTNIRPALLNTPPNVKWKWHAEYDASTAQYRLAIFGPGTGPDEFSGCDHHWILDLSNGPPSNAETAVWWGPQAYVQPATDTRYRGTHCLLTKDGNEGTREMFGLAWYSVNAGDNGDVEGIGLLTLSADGSRDCAAPQQERVPFSQSADYAVGDQIVPYDEDPGTCRPQVWVVGVAGTTAASTPQFNDGVSTSIVSGGVTFASNGPTVADFLPLAQQSGNEILPEFISKEYTGDPTKDKLLDSVELGQWVSETGLISYRIIPDIDENSRVLKKLGDVLGVTGFESTPLPNPGATRGQRIWGSRLLTPTPGSRSVAKAAQFRFTHGSEFVVDETNDAIVVSEALGTKYTIAVTRGEYTHDGLMTAITDALQNNFAAQWEFSTQQLGSESIQHIRVADAGSDLQLWFADTSALDAATAADIAKCARLFSMLGFDTNNATFNTGVGSGYLNVPAGVPGAWVSARSSAETTRTFRMQISSLNLKIKQFRRGPT